MKKLKIKVLTLKRYNVPFILFADEIQDLYLSDPSHPYEDYLNNVSDILEIGKNKIGYGIISGSSSRLKNMIFKKNGYENKYEKYPNLNDTVFNNDRLLPIRDKCEMNAFLNYKYQILNANDDATTAYYHTGGLIGIIEAYVSNDNNYYFNQQGISHSELNTISKRRKISNYMDVVYMLIDKGLIYEINEEMYEFLYPSSIHTLNSYFMEIPTKMELMAFEGTLSKWGGSSSPGHSNEKLIKRYLVRWDGFDVS
ncbi:hypothetical protein BY458DRAFT_570357, partial [Sporodiniella umbellata]